MVTVPDLTHLLAISIILVFGCQPTLTGADPATVTPSLPILPNTVVSNSSDRPILFYLPPCPSRRSPAYHPGDPGHKAIVAPRGPGSCVRNASMRASMLCPQTSREPTAHTTTASTGRGQLSIADTLPPSRSVLCTFGPPRLSRQPPRTSNMHMTNLRHRALELAVVFSLGKPADARHSVTPPPRTPPDFSPATPPAIGTNHLQPNCHRCAYRTSMVHTHFSCFCSLLFSSFCSSFRFFSSRDLRI